MTLARNGRDWVVRNLDVDKSLDRFAEFYFETDEGKRWTRELRSFGTKHFKDNTAPAACAPR